MEKSSTVPVKRVVTQDKEKIKYSFGVRLTNAK